MADARVPLARGPARHLIVLYTRLRSFFGIVVGTAFTGVCSLLVLAVSLLGRHETATAVIHYWARVCMKLFGIGVCVRGEENLPAEGGGIIVFNHQSLFDIPVIICSTRKNIRFGAKIELFKIPFFGAAMRACGTLPIARENRSKVFRVYKDAEARFKMNTLFVLAPEGTRQKEPVIGRFKKGPFFFALNAGVPLIPVVLKGTHAVLPKKSVTVNVGRLHRDIQVEYLPAVSTKEYGSDLDSLLEKVRAAMVDAYARLPEDDQA